MTGRIATAVRLAAVAGLLALAVLAGGVTWLARSEWGRRWTASRIGTALGPSVRFVSARFALWPLPLAIELDGVDVLGANGAPAARARRIVGRVSPRAILGRPPLLADVQIDGVEAEITRQPDGTVSLGADAPGPRGSGGVWPSLDAECPRVDLRDGRLTLRDAGDAAAPEVQIEDLTAVVVPTYPGAQLSLGGRSAQLGTVHARVHLGSLDHVDTAAFRAEIEAGDVDAGTVAVWLPRGGGALSMSGRGRLTASLSGRPSAGEAAAAFTLREGRIAWHERLDATAPVELSLQGRWGADALLTADGAIDIAEAHADGVSMSAVHAAFAADRDGVTLHDGSWKAFAGAWRQSGEVRLADRVTIDGAVDADGVDSAALAGAVLPLFGDPLASLRLHGPARLRLAATGTVGESIQGHLDASLASGGAAWATATAAAPLSLAADIGVTPGAVTLRNAHAAASSVDARDLRATGLDARFAVADGVVQIDALRAQAFDGSWTVSGRIPLAGPPALTVSATGVNAAHLARAFLTGRHEDTGTAGDVDVTATITDRGGPITLRLASPTLTIGRLAVAQPATAGGTLAWSGGALQVRDGHARFAAVRVAGTDVGNVRAAFASAGPDALRVRPLTARAFGGAWTVDATLARDRIDATIRADGVALDSLLVALDARPRSRGATASFTATVGRPRQGATRADVAVQIARGRVSLDELVIVAPARGTGAVRVEGSGWTVSDASASAAAARYGPLQGTGASAAFGFDPAQVRFTDLRFTAAGAPWQASGRLDLASPVRLDGAIAVTRADPDAVLAMFGATAPTLDPDGLDLSLQAQAVLDAHWRQSARGSGVLTLRGGTLNSTAVLRAILAAVVPTRLLRPTGAPNRLRDLTLHFTLDDARAHTDDLRTQSDDYTLTAAGSIGLDGALALESQVTLTPVGIKKVFALGDVPIPGSSLLSLPTIPARIDGTLADPHVHPEAAALAGTTARWFVDALVGAPRSFGQAVERPLGMLFDGIRTLVDPHSPTPTAAAPGSP